MGKKETFLFVAVPQIHALHIKAEIFVRHHRDTEIYFRRLADQIIFNK